jgi:integrase
LGYRPRMPSVHPNPSKRYPEAHKVRYRLNGKAGATTFPTKDQADRFVRRIADHGLAASLESIGVTTEPRRDTGTTVAEAVERYIAQCPNPDTRGIYRRRARKHITPTLGTLRINQLTTEHVQLWLNAQTFTGTGLTHRYDLLSAALSMAVANGDLRANPAKKASSTNRRGVKLPRAPRKKEPVFLTRDEFNLVLKCIPYQYKMFVEFLAETGCRVGEAAALTPADVDLKSGKVHFKATYSKKEDQTFSRRQTKTAESDRTIRVPQRVLDQLNLSGDLVFTNTYGAPLRSDTFRAKIWLPAVKRSGLPTHRQPRIHDLRHTHASWLLEAGITLPAIQKRLGHTDVMTTLRIYGHAATDSEDKIIAALDVNPPM